MLEGLADRYATTITSPDESSAAGLVEIGRELFQFLNGDVGDLDRVLSNAARPISFEVRGPLDPSATDWAILRAPFELLADDKGFLAADEIRRFSPLRRLGTPSEPEPLDEYRLGLAFMASSPRGQSVLDYEAEENAILRAVNNADLWVEESGDPKQLQERLNELEPGLRVVHLSCHGLNNWKGDPDAEPTPIMAMEDEIGNTRYTNAPKLIQWLNQPRMIFLSACLTARSANAARDKLPPGPDHKQSPVQAPADELVAHSFSTALVAGGVPAVLGWDGSVDDRAATAFATKLYDRLADRADLGEAVGDARRELLTSDEPAIKRDWHMARVWLGPTGGGPVVGGAKKRQMTPVDHGEKVFLDARNQKVPVASHEMFVGRRRELQQTLGTFQNSDQIGVLLRGMGRLGKSSLASRIVSRTPGRTPAVVFGTYDALAIIDALRAALVQNKEARELLERERSTVRDNPAALRYVLVDLLSGPCSQADGANKPVLLVVDDLEQVLVSDAGRVDGAHRFDGGFGQVMADVIAAFDSSGTDSRLLVTSRFPFHLDGLEERLNAIHLSPLTETAQDKLQRRQADEVLARVRELNRIEEDDRTDAQDEELRELVVRLGLWGRVVGVAGGNPGLLDLLGARLVFSSDVGLGRVERVLGELEEWVGGGGLPVDEDARAFVENLTVDALLDEAGSASRELLRALTVFGVAVPVEVVDAVGGVFGGRLDRLLALGVADEVEDVVDHRRGGFQVNRLARGRVGGLSDGEAEVVLGAGLGVLFDTWGGAEQQPGWPSSVNVELTTVGVRAGDACVVEACAGSALGSLLDSGVPADEVLVLGEAALEVLVGAGVVPPLLLFRRLIKAADRVGDGERVEALFESAFQHHTHNPAETNIEPAADGDRGSGGVLGLARLSAEWGERLFRVGDTEQALTVFTRARDEFVSGGSDREAAAAWAKVADVHHHRGDYDEVLRIRLEEQLPVFERFGDARSTAVTWSRIADVHYQRGDLDEVLRIRREECLPVYERIGDTRSTAVTWSQIADVHHRRGDYEEVLRIRREKVLPVFERIGDTLETAVTWGQIADVHYRRGDYDEMLRIRREKVLPVYERIGDTRSTAVTWGKIADVHLQRGENDEALRIQREECLPVYEQIGDTRSTAVTWNKIAQAHHALGQLGEARSYQEKCLEVNRGLGDIDGIAFAQYSLAQLDLEQDNLDAAFPRLVEAFQLFMQMQRPDGIAQVGGLLGQILHANQHPQTADVLQAAINAHTKLGNTTQANQLQQLLNDA